MAKSSKTKVEKLLYWTKEEVALLKQLYVPSNPILDISHKMGRSVGAVRSKAHKLGLKKGHPLLWSKEEVEFLKKMYPTTTAREIAHKLGKSRNAIIAQIFMLKLKKR